MNFSFDAPFLTQATAMSALLLVLKLTGVLLLALGVGWLMRRTSASARHLVWLVALIAALVLPLWSAWTPVPVRVLPAASPFVIETAPPVTPVQATTSIAPSNSARAVPTAPARRSIGVGTWLLAIWAFGVVVLLARLALGAWVVGRIVRRARPLQEPDWQRPLYEIADRLDLHDAPRLVQSDRIKMPFATGFLKAVIVLPAESAGWSVERRCAVLIHELAHVKRRDLVGHLVGAFACTFYWFHPLVWTAARHLRAESERACDDLALVLGTPATDYAEHLLEIVTEVQDEYRMPTVALAMAKPTEFEGRMLAILDPRRYRRAPSRVQTAWLVGSLTALALLVGAVSPARRVTASPPAADAGARSTAVVLEHEPMKLAAAPTKEQKFTRTQTKSQTKQTIQVHNSDEDEDADTDIAATKDTKSAHRAEVLAKSLRTDSDAEVRRVAAWGLSRYASNEVATKALADAVLREQDKDVREMAAWALSDSRSPVAQAAIESAFLRDKSPDVRRTAAWAAGNIGSPSSVEGLTKLLSDPDPEVREVVAWSIGSCSPERAPAALVRLLGDPNRDVRQSVAWALYEIHDASTADEIEAAFHREKDHEVQRGLIRALGAMGDPSVELLTRLVNSTDPEIRAIAVAALAGGDVSGPWPWPRPEPRPFP